MAAAGASHHYSVLGFLLHFPFVDLCDRFELEYCDGSRSDFGEDFDSFSCSTSRGDKQYTQLLTAEPQHKPIYTGDELSLPSGLLALHSIKANY